ncbi:MAG: cytochrome P460 family protein [Flavobacteriales bacterium]|nr:cytochrome P460 family protein [Flavobacteriales bacterium]
MSYLRPILSILCILILGYSCKKAKGTDADLLSMAEETEGFTWYKFNDAILEKSTGSAHPQSLLRTKYNATASSALDEEGKVTEGTVFPDGSLIVKELYDDENTIGRWAILYKQSNHEDADDNGWVWGYINGDRSVAAPASNKGEACISCHSQSENIDYTLMNKYFP